MSIKPMPHGKDKAQLWQRIKSDAPLLAATLSTFAERFPGAKVKSFDFDGVTYYDPADPPPDPEKVYRLDDEFLMRLPAAERQKHYDRLNPKSAYERAKAAKPKKGKR